MNLSLEDDFVVYLLYSHFIQGNTLISQIQADVTVNIAQNL